MNQNTPETDQQQGPEQRLELEPDHVELERIPELERILEPERIPELKRLREADQHLQHLEPGQQFELERILEP